MRAGARLLPTELPPQVVQRDGTEGGQVAAETLIFGGAWTGRLDPIPIINRFPPATGTHSTMK